MLFFDADFLRTRTSYRIITGPFSSTVAEVYCAGTRWLNESCPVSAARAGEENMQSPRGPRPDSETSLYAGGNGLRLKAAADLLQVRIAS